jgi:hypothetical protein
MIWSAIFLRSEDRRGERFLIYSMVSKIIFLKEIFSTMRASIAPNGGAMRGERGGRTVGFFLNIFKDSEARE